MAQSLIRNIDPRALSTTLAEALAAAEDYLRTQHAPATRRAYAADWRGFHAWCAVEGLDSLPASAETVALFLSSEARRGRRPATLARRAAAIRLAHRAADLEPPTSTEIVKATLRGIRRTVGGAPAQKAPALAEHVRAMAALADEQTLAGLRDRAVLLLGFAGAFRRAELVALAVEDLEETDKGLRVTVRRSKTDPEGAGEVVPVIRGARDCPVRALNAWRAAAGIDTGALFRRVHKGGRTVGQQALTPYSVALIVKKYAEKAGLDPTAFAGHSLRAGFLTSAALNRASLFKMREVSRHKSLETLRAYLRRAEEFDDHAGEGLL